MTTDTRERNEAIALFNGFTFVNDDLDMFPQGYYYFDGLCKTIEEMEYDSLWDWLMPVGGETLFYEWIKTKSI